MKRFSEQLHNKAQSVKLQAIEREALLERIGSYMEYHPLPGKDVKKKTAKVTIPVALAFSDTLISIPNKLLYRVSAAVALFLFIIVPALAEKSVPGDNLYAVKVRFNEELYSTLIFNQKDKVEWETERLNRRIAEARLLASEGKLNGEVSAQIAEAVREHTEAVKHEIEELRGDDADAATLASIELNTTLKTQSTSISETSSASIEVAHDQDSTQFLVDVLNESVAKEADGEIPSYDKIMARVEQNTTRSYELLEDTKLANDDPLRTEIVRRLEDVGRSIAEANSSRSEDEVNASRILIDALERTQKVIVYMSDLDANRTVAIETVVPKILTDEEKKNQLAMFNVEINHRVELLETTQSKLDKNVAEKVSYSIKTAKEKQREANADVSRMSAKYGEETLTMLDDAIKIVTAAGVDVNSVNEVALPDATETASTTATTTGEVAGDGE
jgi:hypothetical protein